MGRPDAEMLLRQLADDLPLLALCATTRPPQTSEGMRVPPGPRAPLSVDVLDLQSEIHAVLGGWVRVCHEDDLVDADDWPADFTLALCLWLASTADLLAHHEAADEFADEVADLHRRVRRAIGETPPRPLRCTRVVGEQHCGGRITGIDSDGRETEVREHWRWCKCRDCGQTYTFDAALRRLGVLQRLSVPQYAAEHGLPVRTVSRWVREDGLSHSGRLGANPIYDRDDLDRVVADSRRESSRSS